MAEAWGNTAGSKGRWQALVKAYVLSETRTTATIRCQTYFHSIGYGFNVYGNGTATANGQSSYSGTVTCYSPTGGTVNQLLATKDVTVSKTASGFNVWCSGTVNITGGFQNGTSSAGLNVWVPARQYSKPRPPKGFSVERVSDSSQRLTWQGDYTGMDGDYPWSNVRVNRATDSGARENIAVLSWSAVNYTDNSTEPGRRYDYDVESTNPAGTSEMAGPIAVYTTPRAPTRAVAEKKSASVVEVSLTGHSGWFDSVEAQVTDDGGSTWLPADSSFATEGGALVVSVSTVPAGTVRYRLRLVKGGLASDWAETGSIVTIAPPLAPTITGVESVYAKGDIAKVSWVPNHPDGSRQTSATVECSGTDGATGEAVTDYIDVSGSVASVELDTSRFAVGEVSVRVRTKGLHEEWGAWSNAKVFRVADAPQAWFSEPATDGYVAPGLPIAASWVVIDGTGVSSQRLRLLDSDGGVVLSRDVGSDARSATFGSYGEIANKGSYSIELDVSVGSGLRAVAVRRFSTDWEPPAPASVSVSYDERLAAHITVGQGDSSGNPDAPEATSFDIVRVLADGSRFAIAGGVMSGQSAIDRLPPLNADFAYEVTAHSESGQTSVRRHVTRCVSRFAAINFGIDAGQFMRSGLDAEFDVSASHSREFYHFASGSAGSLPVRYDSNHIDVSIRASWTLLSAEEASEVRRVSRACSWGWFRDLDGNAATVSLDIGVGRSATGLRSWSVSVDMVESVWEDPVNGDV